jgi:hypothetical protein
MSEQKKPVVITTGADKGVFFGYLEKHDQKEKVVTLIDCRMCVYWSHDVRGVVGLAKNGPTTNCKITAAAPKAIIANVNAVFVCTDEATKAWEVGPWA